MITPEEIAAGLRSRYLGIVGLIGAVVAAELVVLGAIILTADKIVNGRTIWGALAAAVLP